MRITVASLIAAGVAPTQARIFADPLDAACGLFEINTPARVAALVAQCRVESANFTRTEESLFYTSPERIRQIWPTRVPSMADAAKLTRNPQALANRVYANRNGNFDEASGDGWKFIGRGLIQLTGRANYSAAAHALRQPYMEEPKLVARPTDACLTAAWFFHVHGLNALADASLVDGITRKVNGPRMLEADLRRQYTQEAIRAFA
jgi:putative chitinase